MAASTSNLRLGRYQLAQNRGPTRVRKWWADLDKDGVGTTARDHAYRLLRAILNQAVRDDIILAEPVHDPRRRIK